MYVFDNRRIALYISHPHEAYSQERLWFVIPLPISHRCRITQGWTVLLIRQTHRLPSWTKNRPGGYEDHHARILTWKQIYNVAITAFKSVHFMWPGHLKREFNATVVNGTVSLISHRLWEWTRQPLRRFRDILQPWDLFFGQYWKLDPQRFQSNNFGQLTFNLEGEPDFLGCYTRALQ